MSAERTTSDLVFDKIFMGIATGEYPKGSRLPSENELCSKYGVSRVTVRAALQRLLALELVETNTGGGTYVKTAALSAVEFNSLIPYIVLEPNDMWEMLEFRQGIEAMAAYHAARKATEQDIIELNALYERMSGYYHNQENASYAETDYELHRMIAHMARNSMLERVNSIIGSFFQKQIFETNVYLNVDVGFDDHRRIIHAIAQNNPKAASFYAEEHVGNTMQVWKKHWESSEYKNSKLPEHMRRGSRKDI